VTPPRGRGALPPVESGTGGTERRLVRTAREMKYVPVAVAARPGAYAFLPGGGAPAVFRVPRSGEDTHG